MPHTSIRSTVAAFTLCMPALTALGGLEEQNVLILYNSLTPESLVIRDAYIAHHPGIHQFDLDLDYPYTEENWGSEVPPPEGICNHYITSAKFTELFVDDASAFQLYLAAHPEVVAIATTRGLPAVVSDNFDPPVNHDGPSAENIWGSFEGLLSRSASGNFHWQEGSTTSRHNPYQGSTRPFLEVLADCGTTGGICPGDLHLVSRLDSSRCAIDYDGNGTRTNLDGVLALIDRCAEPIPVNTYATSMIYDDNPPEGEDGSEWCTHGVKLPIPFIGSMVSFWRDNWCQFSDRSEQFLHGPTDDDFDPTSDAIFQEFPLVSLVTMGQNHCGSSSNPDERVYYDYIRRYQAHPAGFFNSIESYNGQSLHKFNASPGGHGQALDWIGYAGGSFTTAHVQGITTAEFTLTFLGLQNLHHNGFTWGEAIYTFLRVGGYSSPIGDPLASVVIIRPDINEDFIVDELDKAIVLQQMGTSGPEGDVDHSGLVDEADLAEITAAYGRARPEIELPEPLPAVSACGDVNWDGIVDISDILVIISEWGSCPFQGSCPADTDGDYEVAIGDLLTVISRWGWVAGDLNGDGIVNINDMLLILDILDSVPGDDGWNDGADTNCDGVIDNADLAFILVIIDMD